MLLLSLYQTTLYYAVCLINEIMKIAVKNQIFVNNVKKFDLNGKIYLRKDV